MASSKTFKPSDYQAKLPLDELILKDQPAHDEQVPMDVLFVGAGPAGLAGAIELARLVKKDAEAGGDLGEIEIGVLEKAENLGGHSLSGAVINPKSLKELFPELNVSELPLRQAVKGDAVYMLSETSSTKIPTPPTMHNEGNHVASICEVIRWMGEQAEGLGVNLLTSFPADALLTEGSKVTGVRTTPMGLNRDGSPGDQHMPATDVLANVTVLTEGTRGALTQAYLEWQNVSSPRPQIYALGVKELWRCKKTPEKVTHTMGWPLPKDAFGGSFMYPMGDDLVSLGLVVGLDYHKSNLDVHHMLQSLKKHPLVKQYLEDGELVEWGAKTIPEGGLESLPERLYGDGLLMAGDAVGMVNVPALKGIHYAIQSGIFAARAIFKALKSKDYSSATLKSYDDEVRSSYIFKELYKVRNMRHAFKDGFYMGGIKAGLMTLTGGAFPAASGPYLEDAAENKTFEPDTDSSEGISKVDAVYLSGNKTRDDIPQHLSVGDSLTDDVSGDVAEFYSHVCPAGVYERQGDKLVVNAPNCIDCKATDILGPRWRPREGGAGPDYKQM